MRELKVLELFGGIGACTQAFKGLGLPYKVVDYVEVDKYAVQSYNAMNNTTYKPQDIREWDKEIEVDFIMHGSPCQDFSIAGTRRGANEGSGTRSSLMYETVRIVRKLRPKYVLWENVKNVLCKGNIHNFEKYLEYMEELGYCNHFKVLDSADYGVPQRRERIFCLSILEEPHYIFPEPIELELSLEDILEDSVEEKYYINDTRTTELIALTIQKEKARVMAKKICRGLLEGVYEEPKWLVCEQRVDEGLRFFTDNICGTIRTTSAGGDKRVLEKPIRGVQAGQVHMRRLTPLECWRLMGFPDTCYSAAEKVNSANQLYRQAGNSIVVDILVSILKEIEFD